MDFILDRSIGVMAGHTGFVCFDTVGQARFLIRILLPASRHQILVFCMTSSAAAEANGLVHVFHWEILAVALALHLCVGRSNGNNKHN